MGPYLVLIVVIASRMVCIDASGQFLQEICLAQNDHNDRYASYSPVGETLPVKSSYGKYLLITAYRNGSYEIC